MLLGIFFKKNQRDISAIALNDEEVPYWYDSYSSGINNDIITEEKDNSYITVL